MSPFIDSVDVNTHTHNEFVLAADIHGFRAVNVYFQDSVSKTYINNGPEMVCRVI